MALWIPGLGASPACLHTNTSSETQPMACGCCAASWQASQALSAPSGLSSGRQHTRMSIAASGGLRRFGTTRQAAQEQLAQPDQLGPSRVRGASDPSSDAIWMHPSPSRSSPLRDKALLQPAFLGSKAVKPVLLKILWYEALTPSSGS